MRAIQSPSTDPRFNLALEQYIFDQMPRNRSYLMLWRNDQTIVVGKHQDTFAEINADYVRANQIQVVRRLSGARSTTTWATSTSPLSPTRVTPPGSTSPPSAAR